MNAVGESMVTCYRCRRSVLIGDALKAGGSHECKECKCARSKVYRDNNKLKCATYAKKRRKERLVELDGKHVETVQTCWSCKFEGLSSNFVRDKSFPTGHNNTCLKCARERSRKWKRANREKVRGWNRQYKVDNREKVNAYAKAYACRLPVKIKVSVRGSISRAMRGLPHSARSLELLGVKNIADYIRYLEDRFEFGMSWANYGNGLDKWNIDHIKPVFRFDLTIKSQMRKAFHFTNTRPMWQRENASNGAIARWRKVGK